MLACRVIQSFIHFCIVVGRHAPINAVVFSVLGGLDQLILIPSYIVRQTTARCR